MNAYDLIVAGGVADSNVLAFAEAAERRGLQVLRLLHQAEREPAFSWDFQTGGLLIDGAPISARSGFIRYDVFTPRPTGSVVDRNYAWFNAVYGWMLTQQSMRLLNRGLDHRSSYKSYTLVRAAQLGLRIPRTLVSNVAADIDAFGPPENLIAKPVAGGAYTQTLSDAHRGAGWHAGTAPFPAFVQQRLIYPEYRVYLVGTRFVCFDIQSTKLDYRPDSNSQIRYLGTELPWPELAEPLQALAAESGVDFCAFDLKTDAESGAPVFLELNSGPMFAAYNQHAHGQLINTMIDYLIS